MADKKPIKVGGKLVYVPADATEDEINELFSSPESRERGITNPKLVDSGLADKPGFTDYFRHYIGKHVPGILASAGGTAGALGGGSTTFGLGTIGGAAAGAGLGSVAGIELQNELPELFGERPENTTAFAERVVGDIASEALLPEGLSSISKYIKPIVTKAGARLFPAVKEGVARQEGRILSDQIIPQSAILDRTARNTVGGNSPIADELDLIRKGKGDYSKLTKDILSDVSKVRDFKVLSGNPHDIQNLALNDILTRNYKGDKKVFNIGAILDELSGPKREVWEEAIGKTGIKNFKSFLDTAQRMPAGHDNVIQYTKNRILFNLPYIVTGAALGSVGGGTGMVAGATAGATAHVILNNKVIAKLMENPLYAETARNALRTPLKGREASMQNRVLTNILRSVGEVYDVMTPEGKVEKMTLNEDGTLTPAKR